MTQRSLIVLLALILPTVCAVVLSGPRMDKAINTLTVELKNAAKPGKQMPISGLGTGGYNNPNHTGRGEYWGDGLAFYAVQNWLALGGKRIDTSLDYLDLKGVGDALLVSGYSSGPKRASIFITIKVGPRFQFGYDETIQQVHDSLEKLHTAYADLILIHWPAANPQVGPDGKPVNDTSPCHKNVTDFKQCRIDTWRALVSLWRSGVAHAIGVSNFESVHIEDIIQATGVVPAVNQIEFSPFWHELDLLDYLFSKNILPNGYASLGTPDFMEPVWHHLPLNATAVTTIAQRYGKTNAQVLLRMSLDLGLVVNPRTSSLNHMQENLDAKLIGWNLSSSEIQSLLSIPNDSNTPKVCPDPRKMY